MKGVPGKPVRDDGRHLPALVAQDSRCSMLMVVQDLDGSTTEFISKLSWPLPHRKIQNGQTGELPCHFQNLPTWLTFLRELE